MSPPHPAHGGASENELAREVETLRSRVDRLTEDLDRALALVDDALNTIHNSAEQEAPTESRQPGTRIGNVPLTWCSRDLSSGESGQLREVLGEWVTWLRGRYPIAKELPECWIQHPELVEELTALYAAWHGAYRDRRASTWAPADWHDRLLPGFLSRIRGWGVACSLGDHRARGAGTYAL